MNMRGSIVQNNKLIKDIERVNKLDSCYLPHPKVRHAMNVIEESILLSASSTEPQNVVISGNAGTGKTTICNAIVKRRKREFITKKGKQITRVPAFYCLTPSPATIKSLASTMLKALGEPVPKNGTRSDLTHRLGVLLKECETEVILLDELQHILVKETYSVEQEVKNWLKTIINMFKVPIIAVGTPECRNVINGDSQLARRFVMQCGLGNLDFGSDEKSEYRRFINGLANICIKELNFESFPDFRSRDNALAVFISTGGNPSDTTQLFKKAARIALSDKRETVELKDFEQAIDSLVLPNFLKKLDSSGNPFRLSQAELDRAYSNI